MPERVRFPIHAKEVHKKRRFRYGVRVAMSWIERQGDTSPVTLARVPHLGKAWIPRRGRKKPPGE